MKEVDITIDKGDTSYKWLIGLPRSTCQNGYDLEAAMTHEWGHGHGLGHALPDGEHRQQTMSRFITPCSTFQRTLGYGDYLGMWHIYGLR